MTRKNNRNRCSLLAGLGASVAVLAFAATPAAAQSSRQPALQDQLDYVAQHGEQTGKFTIVPLRPLVQVRGQEGVVTTQNGIYVIQGPDGNSTVQIGPEGAVVVDAQTKANTPELVAKLKGLLGPTIIRFVFMTNGDPERSGGAKELREAGKAIFGGNMAGQVSDLADEAVHMSHENVLNRLSGVSGDPPADEGTWPKETYAEEEYDFHLNDEGVQFFHVPNAHTDGDSLVFFRRSDVIVAGDIWDTNTYPRIDLKHGGSINGVIDGLNHVIALTIPGNKQEGGTLVVPGRGRPGDEAEVVEYRDMLTIIRDRIKDMADKGMSLEQIKAAKPSYDYDGRFGATSGPWTTDMFISAVYEGVKPQRQRGRAAR
jgi:glyoxylase-like metal-dependent hydrolase (beta-lactamase superfamily II)